MIKSTRILFLLIKKTYPIWNFFEDSENAIVIGVTVLGLLC